MAAERVNNESLSDMMIGNVIEARNALDRAQLCIKNIEMQLRPNGFADPELAYMTAMRYLRENGILPEKEKF